MTQNWLRWYVGIDLKGFRITRKIYLSVFLWRCLLRSLMEREKFTIHMSHLSYGSCSKLKKNFKKIKKSESERNGRIQFSLWFLKTDLLWLTTSHLQSGTLGWTISLQIYICINFSITPKKDIDVRRDKVSFDGKTKLLWQISLIQETHPSETVISRQGTKYRTILFY